MKKITSIGLIWLFATLSTWAQTQQEIIQTFLNQHHTEQGLTKADVTNWQVSSQHTSNTSGATHVYLQQTHQGIPVSNGVANIALKDGMVKSMGNRLVPNLHTRITHTTPSLSPIQAIQKASQALKLATPQQLSLLKLISSQQFIYTKGGISKENIPVQLVYYAAPTGAIKLAWELSIYTLDAQHWWAVQIDAQTGELLQQVDWVVHCDFNHNSYQKRAHTHTHHPQSTPLPAPEIQQQPDQYTVYALPIESPNHGSRSVVTNPADILASPYGWHDENGAIGAEHTITRGNNVYAYEDTASTNSPGFSPDGNAVLEFNFPFVNNNNPGAYQSAAVTNLFYMNNMLHDILYQHGFDESSGNFQFNNYNRGGVDGDAVQAEAQDGSGTNNANFATPSDGNTPRMQMFLWNNFVEGNYLTINSPAAVAGTYNSIGATFGPTLPSTALTANLVLIQDANAPTTDGCDPIINSAALAGNIVVIDRGACAFTTKVAAAEGAGAIAVIVINNVSPGIRTLTGFGSSIMIPSVMISLADGNLLKAALQSGAVSASLSDAGNTNLFVTTDSDYDNGVIAHEYGHGVSNRLTGGGANASCLFNDEQMGEGWSDWLALMLTMEAGDTEADIRGIATYSSNQLITDRGIRPAPYSTDFAINNFTYAASNDNTQISQPHGIGFIFATMLWDLNWALINQYGGVPNPNLYTGTGGNNIAMKLVLEGMKLQPCATGMVDGRNAILQADQLLYNGAHECLIWEVFARRGLGFSARQGSAFSRYDQVEAFDLPPSCQVVTLPPTAAFEIDSISTCDLITFVDTSFNTPQTWFWNFGDGATSSLRNPSHQYTNGGTYAVKLLVGNSLGQDSITQMVTITLPSTPVVNDVEVCAGDAAIVTTGTLSGIAQWRDATGAIVQKGNPLTVPNVTSTQLFSVENVEEDSIKRIGSSNYITSSGAYDFDYNGISFTAERPLEIVSVLIKTGSSGTRPYTFILSHNTSASSSTGGLPLAADIVEQRTINLPQGTHRIDLNFLVPDKGEYNLGVDGASMFFDFGYFPPYFPYEVPGYLRMTSSIYANTATQYQYLYDWEVRAPSCISAKDSFVITPITSNFSFSSTNNRFNFSDASVGASSWFWQFGDGDSSTAQNPVHTYANTGTYTVSLTINNGSCSSTQTVTITVLATNDLEQDQWSFALLPNPSYSTTTLLLGRVLEEEVQVQLVDITGKICQQQVLSKGQKSLVLDVSQLPSAVYLVQLTSKSFQATQKLVVH